LIEQNKELMIIKIFSIALLIIAAFMGLKQGWAMLSGSEPMLDMFSKWHFHKSGVRALGLLTLGSSLMIVFPQTYLAGNFLMATSILLVLCLQLSSANLKGAAIEVPFILMNLMLIYFQYPTIKVK
jgi:hypothetical protein